MQPIYLYGHSGSFISTMDSYSLLGHYVIPYTLYLVLYNGCLMPRRHVMYPTHISLIKHYLSLHISLPCQWRAHLLCSFTHTYLLCCPMDLALTSYSSSVLIYFHPSPSCALSTPDKDSTFLLGGRWLGHWRGGRHFVGEPLAAPSDLCPRACAFPL
jgi:hypothetical protein